MSLNFLSMGLRRTFGKQISQLVCIGHISLRFTKVLLELPGKERPTNSPGVWVWQAVYLLPGLRWRAVHGNAGQRCKGTKQLFHETCREMLTVQKPHEGNKSSKATVTYADTNSLVYRMLFADMTSSSNPHIKPVRQVAEGILNSPCLWWKSLPNIRTAYHSTNIPSAPATSINKAVGSSGLFWKQALKDKMDLPIFPIH